MIYELRVYTAKTGKMEQMAKRFREDTLRIFDRHGIKVLGVFTPTDSADQLYYITAFPDEAARKRA